ncbi:MAG TPA: PEGA domain-containing protein [Spirochaetia bacterium]|nr:PEGA domain-containing protein [Spirochaetales bacterium]HPD80253.1 PEGA domain-containing protein [Spirochaetales bacterium]HQK34225.1 PEGA domain-containing protein [Spirochaetales bacterium]HRS64730.1 PEGA domain-containing protein [Spirochaetia bacterium]HRV27650.1 PEGA domain-containing protein [Spirochaetia bacterium]
MKKLFMFLLFCSCVFIYATEEEPPRITVETLEQQGLASLVVQTDISAADVYINGFFCGITPFSVTGIKPDTYLISIKKKGYKERSISVTLSANTKTTVFMNLIPATGYLSINSPQNLEIVINGKTYQGNFIEIPEGKYTCTARAFGFEDEIFYTEIFYNKTTYQTINLKEAEFSIDTITASNTTFNPRNAGLFGFTAINFNTTTYGFAEFSVVDETGTPVFSYTTPSFTTWEQTIRWNGRDSNNKILPDGTYTIHIEFFDTSRGLKQSTTFSYEGIVVIDSSLVFYPEPEGGISPGSFFAPSIIPPNTMTLKTSTGFSYTSTDSFDEFGLLAFILKLSLSMPALGKLQLGTSISTDPDLLQATVSYLLPALKTNAVAAGFAVSSIIQSSTAGGTNISLGIPITLGSREISFTTLPGIMFTWLSDPTLQCYTELALQYSSFSLTTALSSRFITSNLLREQFTFMLPALLMFDIAFIPRESFIEIGFWAGLIFKELNTDFSTGLMLTFKILSGGEL